MEYYDVDGFKLEFEYDTSPEERHYYSQKYTNVNLVANKKNHCTSCSIHIGTPPSAETNLQMHTILRVTQCSKCYRFYNSGAFVKGEDGNELHCRWCGEGGTLYCCSACPYVFCQKCIVRNLTATGLKEVLSNDDWKCYACAPEILYPLRAQHWALVNFIKKQKKSLESKISKGLKNEDKIVFLMKKDSSICCPSKTTAPKRQRPITYDDDEDELWSESVDSENRRRSSKRIKNKVKDNKTSRKGLRKKKRLRRSSETPTSSAARNEVRLSRARKSRSTTSSSTVTSNSDTAINVESVDCKPDLSPYIFGNCLEMNGDQNESENGTVNMINNEQETPTTSKPNSLPQEKQTQSLRMAVPTREIQAQTPAGNAIQQPNTNVDTCRTQLQNQMFNCSEICGLVDGKLRTLANSITYKTTNNMNDIKELYNQLSDLLAYTNSRVQSLHEKCIDDMRQFGFENHAGAEFMDESEIENDQFNYKNDTAEELGFENDPRDDGDESEVEIIEPTQTTIILDDSDEEHRNLVKGFARENLREIWNKIN